VSVCEFMLSQLGQLNCKVGHIQRRPVALNEFHKTGNCGFITKVVFSWRSYTVT
jgi:hypothetical protein